VLWMTEASITVEFVRSSATRRGHVTSQYSVSGPRRGAERILTKCRHGRAMSNEQIARQIVAKLLAFRTVTPFGTTWEGFAVAEILLALNAASRPQIRHKRSAARREPYETEGR
jgi:hypothetical protein